MLKTRSAASIYMPTVLLNGLNAAFWSTYALAIKDVWMCAALRPGPNSSPSPPHAHYARARTHTRARARARAPPGLVASTAMRGRPVHCLQDKMSRVPCDHSLVPNAIGFLLAASQTCLKVVFRSGESEAA